MVVAALKQSAVLLVQNDLAGPCRKQCSQPCGLRVGVFLVPHFNQMVLQATLHCTELSYSLSASPVVHSMATSPQLINTHSECPEEEL